MNDYWNDPPESPEPPACPNDKPKCEGSGEYLYDGKTGWVFSCDICGYQWVVPYPPDPVPDDQPSKEQIEEALKDDGPKTCPHGKTESCDACDYASDIAYDSAREKKFR